MTHRINKSVLIHLVIEYGQRSQKTGLNFIPLHAYGGTILLSFLRREDAEEIQVFLQNTVYNRPQSVQASE